MARMLGVCQRDWCPGCQRSAGIDCPSVARSKGQARAAEKRAWRHAELAEALDELRVVAAGLPPLQDEPGAVDELAAEIETWAPLRQEATGELLGDG